VLITNTLAYNDTTSSSTIDMLMDQTMKRAKRNLQQNLHIKNLVSKY